MGVLLGTHFRPICWFVMAWIMPMGIVYTNAGGYSLDELGEANMTDLQIIKASTNAQTGNCVFHTSIEMTPKTNMDTVPNANHQLP